MDEAQLRASLWPSERVLWMGRPGGGLRFTMQDWFVIPFSVVWLGIASTIFLGDGFHQAEPFPFVFMPALFLAVGLYMLVGRFLLDIWLRSNTGYAITNQRAVIVRTGLWPTNRSIGLNSHMEMNMVERPDGSGTIRFGGQKANWLSGGNRGQIIPSLDPTPQFLFVDDVRAIFQTVQRAAGSR
jgi:hypothetical protein